MTSYHYTLSDNNAHKNKIFAGFSQLQKQEEFVDLTLAADGYLIKVHRNIIAVASPYLKEMLKSVPNHSPVVFLNNVSHEVLSYLLEYIYQGEVQIPMESIDDFIEVSKSLHIAGIADVQQPQKPPPLLTTKSTNREVNTEKRASEFAAHITIDNSSIIEVQQGPTVNDNLENGQMNVDYELATGMAEDQKKSANITDNAEFIVDDIHNTLYMQNIKQNQEYNRNILQNIPLGKNDTNIESNPNLKQPYVCNLLQTHMPHQENQINVNTISNTPVIDVTTDTTADYSQTNTAQINNFKIILKPQSEMNHTEETKGLPNIPVIVLQHSEFQGQQDEEMASRDHIILPMQTDIIVKALQENPPDPSTDRNLTVNTKVKKSTKASVRKVKILEKQIFKAGIKSSEIIFRPLKEKEGTDVHPLDSKINLDAMKNMAQFSLTERGALQIILNRYIYCHHHSSRQKIRWRCVDYRKRACPAFVDTINGVIAARKGLHTHEFHDKKLYKKHEKDLIYQTIELAKAAQELVKKNYLESVLLDDADSDKTDK